MLTPSRRPRPLLPQDRELIQILGCTVKEYRKFQEECERRARLSPSNADPQAIIIDPVVANILISLAIGIVSTAVSLLLAPRPPQARSPLLGTLRLDGQDIITGDRFSAKSGFDSAQNVVELGSIVPMVYARREVIGATTYGGVRTNTDLLWSQLLSLGGNQLFRGIFLVGQGGIEEIDPLQFAIGDNLLSGYGLDLDGIRTAKVTFYGRLNGGRIRSADQISGRQAGEDDGNFQRRGAPDVYQVPNENNDFRPNACSAVKPATQTTFGLYAPMGSCLNYRVNPVFRPAQEPQTIVRNQGKAFVIACVLNPQVRTDRWRDASAFHPRVSFPGRTGRFNLNRGDEVTMRLATGTDADHEYRQLQLPNARNEDPLGRTVEAETSCLSAGQAVASRQKAIDDALVVGERYLLGTAIAICISRSDNRFQSRADSPDFGDGSSVVARFRVLNGGQAETSEIYAQNDPEEPVRFPPDKGELMTASRNLQVFKIAIASVSIGRKCRVIEVGIRSTLGIRINGLCNFRDCWSYDKIDKKSCLDYEYDPNGINPNGGDGKYAGVSGWPVYRTAKGDQGSDLDLDLTGTVDANGNITITSGANGNKVKNDDKPGDADFLRTTTFQNGVLQTFEVRYSFWRIKYRRAGSNARWIPLSNFYGTRGLTQEPVYNYIRIAFPSYDDWEFEFEPISGWEVQRRGERLFVIDYKEPLQTVNDTGLRLTFPGERVGGVETRRRKLFAIPYFEKERPDDPEPDLKGGFYEWTLGLPRAYAEDGLRNYVDGWDRLSEIFIYDEIETSAQRGPEHEISYINIIEENPVAPQYDDLAIVGMSLRAGPELSQLSQLSAYVTRGLKGIHLFPEVLLDMLINPVYGAKGTMSLQQIDEDSFAAANTFTRNRRYFCDIGLSDPVNRREWASEVAPNYLLDFVSANGRWSLQPAFLLDRPEPITALFTAGNVIEDSFRLTTAELAERLPIQVSVKWREERQGTFQGDRGIFPLIREVTVREAGVPENAPLVRVDMSDYCTSQAHAIDVAKYRCRQVRLQDKTVSFRAFPQYAAVAPGKCFKIAMDNVTYRPRQNAVLDEHGIVVGQNMVDGNYEVLAWSPGEPEPTDKLVTIQNGAATNLTNALISVRSVETNTLVAKTVRVSLNEDAEVEIEGVAFPVDDRGFSLFADGFDDPGRWVIEGAI